MEGKQVDLAVVNNDVALQSETGMLLKMAIDKDLDVDKLEKLIALKVGEEERFCKREFETHFSLMKAELPAIEKNQEARDKDGKLMYKFAPLEDLQDLCDPIITKHGFSYYWEESYISETKSKRVTFFLSGYGFTRANYFDAADIPSNKYANAIQTSGIKTSFGKRYSYQSGLGLVVKGEDTDAIHLTFDDGVQYADQVLKINNCNTKPELIEVWKATWKNLGSDKIGKDILTVVYNKRKEAIK